jgi:hypothetical protein
VIPKSKSAADKRLSVFAFHDYSPQLSTYKRRLSVHPFSSCNHLA